MTIRPEVPPLSSCRRRPASNGIAALLDCAVAIFVVAGIDRRDALDALAPLCRGSPENVLTMGIRGGTTGPIARGDVATVEAHVAALQDRQSWLLPLYRTIARTLIEMARRAATGNKP